MPPDTPPGRERLALRIVQLGAVAVVLIALPYKTFDLDRFFVPKELVLHATAATAAFLCLGGRRRLGLSGVDACIAGFLVLSLISTVFAENWWLAARAIAISISGALLFWVGTTLRRAGLHRQVVAAMAVAVIAGALTALVQAYWGATTDLFSLNRAPGGTFGNRNFMAHLAAIGTPTVVIAALSARSRGGFVFGAIGSVMLAAALVLSRSRAAWLALVATAVVVAGIALITRVSISGGRTWRRLGMLALAAVTGVAGSAFIPNQLDWNSASPYLDSVRGVVNYREGSGAGRVVQYRNSLDMALASPLLGVGPGNWAVEYSKFADRRDPSLASVGGMTDNPWPSSDWVAFISERGIAATLLLALALLAIGMRAFRELRPARETEDFDRATAALTVIGTIVTTVVVGMFDAVLLIAVPTMFMWLLVGVLSTPVERRRGIEKGVHEFLPALLVLFGFVTVARSSTQIAAMSSFHGATRLPRMERAAMYDPGSYRIRMRLAELYASRGNCAGAQRQARAVNDMYPNAAAPKAIIRRCGGSKRG